MRKEITVKVFDKKSEYDLPETPEAFLAYWKEKFERVPEQFRASTRVEVEANTCYDSAQLSIAVSYVRPETDEEMSRRERDEASRLSAQEENERRQLAALKAKYGE